MKDISTRAFIAIILAATIANTLPLFLVTLSGDAIMNYTQVVCYSKQLWQGILYPRWCMDANGGMGSPAPIFYFPFAFYVAALFYPLRYVGIGVDQQYIITIGLANLVTFMTCTLWMRKAASMRVAAFCAFIFLFTSYRVEITNGRQSFAELWCLAFLPLFFMQLHELLYEQKKRWPQMALTLTICFLCHPPVTLIGLMGAGLQTLWQPVRRWKNVLQLGLAALLTIMLTLFETLPIRMLAGELNPDMGGLNHWRQSWVNGFADSLRMVSERLGFFAGLVLALLIAFVIAVTFWRNKAKVQDAVIRHEAMGWVVVMAVAFIMMLSISDPVWNLIEVTVGIKTPWRMASLIMFGMVYVLAVSIRWIWKSNEKTRSGDQMVLALLFIILSFLYVGGVQETEDNMEIHKELVDAQFIVKYFSTKGTDRRYGNADTFFEAFIERPNRKQAEIVQGRGNVTITQWNAQGIGLDVSAQTPAKLRLEHFNFPIWHATLDGKPALINTEAEKGRMLIDIPTGTHELRLTTDYFSILPGYFHWVWLAFAAAATVLAFGFRTNKKRQSF